jgi:hypothetical protein
MEFFDKVKRQTLVALFSSPLLQNVLVLKGGNLIDIAFEISQRSSIDLDFSIEGKFDDPEELRIECESVLRKAFAAQGYRVIDVRLEERPPYVSEELKGYWGGYTIKFKLIGDAAHERFQADAEQLRRRAIRLQGDSPTFKIDISKFEYCEGKQVFQVDGQSIFGYSPEMVIAEKIRAICQQMPEYRKAVRKHLAGRARDFVDIYIVKREFLVNFDTESFRELVERMFAKKRVPIHLIGQISRFSGDHRPSFPAVVSTVRPEEPLEDFDFYVDFLVRECKCLEALWNK